MKSEKLQDAIGEIRDDYILDAHREHGEKKGKKRFLLFFVNLPVPAAE